MAQHAFQHLEKHLRETPTQYILQRFAGNDDQEAIDFKANNDEALKESEIKQFYVEAQTNKIRPCEEKKHFAMAIEVDAILARREDKKEKTKQYQCKLKGKSVEESLWIDRIVLVKMGHLKKVQRQDEKEAMAAGLQSKALTSEAVEKHLLAFGLSAEVASHSQIHSLSGGQKVKVVLGASMWQNPHILVLDEPTNYLDRDGLGALTLALKEWEGGVIIISHNKEFCDAVATEKWIMKAGNLRQEGSSEERGTGDADKSGNKEKEDVFDQFGNKVDMADAEKDAKKLKKELKELEKQIKDNKKKKILSQDEVPTRCGAQAGPGAGGRAACVCASMQEGARGIRPRGERKEGRRVPQVQSEGGGGRMFCSRRERLCLVSLVRRRKVCLVRLSYVRRGKVWELEDRIAVLKEKIGEKK